MSRLVKEKEAADYIGLELVTFRSWVETGRLPRATPRLREVRHQGARSRARSYFRNWQLDERARRVAREGSEEMRVNLKGVHTVTVKGFTYHYAWRGGPRLVG